MTTCRSVNTIKIWDPINDYSLVKTLTGRSGSVFSVIQLSNGMIASGSWDNRIKIWNFINYYFLVNTLTDRSVSAYSVNQSINGTLACGSAETTINTVSNTQIMITRNNTRMHINYVITL